MADYGEERLDYSVSTGFRGKRKVTFFCARCAAELVCPLEEAGQGFDCPKCGQGVIVPGQKELDEQIAAEAADAAQREAGARASAEQAAREAEAVQRKEDARAAVAKAERAAAEKRVRPRRRNRHRVKIAAVLASAVTLAIVYFGWVRPLQRQARETAAALAETQSTLTKTADVLASAIKANDADLESLRKTFNDNVAKANRTTDALSARIGDVATGLIDVRRTANNADRHAHSHDRF